MKRKVKVIFKIHKREVIAIFPFIKWNDVDLVCYAHLGQHGAIDARLPYSLPTAKECEYRDLLNELQNRYNDCELVVIKRMPAWKEILNFIADYDRYEK